MIVCLVSGPLIPLIICSKPQPVLLWCRLLIRLGSLSTCRSCKKLVLGLSRETALRTPDYAVARSQAAADLDLMKLWITDHLVPTTAQGYLSHLWQRNICSANVPYAPNSRVPVLSRTSLWMRLADQLILPVSGFNCLLVIKDRVKLCRSKDGE